MLSGWTAERIEAALAYADRIGLPRPAAVKTTELALAEADSPLWPEYVPFAEVEPVVRRHGLCVMAHLGDVNQGQVLFGGEDAVARMRPEWVSRWDRPRNAPHVEPRVRVRHQPRADPSAGNRCRLIEVCRSRWSA